MKLAKPAPIPVTLLTGFLGAGKTTLLNHILKSTQTRRIAIIENEFGDLGIDGSLVGASPDAIFELNDGCVCCTVREDLIAVFEQLLARFGEFDHVIIETTGTEDSARGAQTPSSTRRPRSHRAGMASSRTTAKAHRTVPP